MKASEASRVTSGEKPPSPRPWFLPPPWLTVILAGGGVYGTGLVYRAFFDGSMTSGLLGLSLLSLGVLALGTPLAYARRLRLQARQNAARAIQERRSP